MAVPHTADLVLHERAPRTQAELYPANPELVGDVEPAGRSLHRSDADLAPLAILRELLAASSWFDELGLRVFAFVTLIPMMVGATLLLELAGLAGDSAITWGWWIAGVTWFAALLIVGHDLSRRGSEWSEWMVPRGGVGVRARRHPSRLLQRFRRRWRTLEAWRLAIGPRELSVDVFVLRRSVREPRLPAAYVGVVRLPDGVAGRLGSASLARRTFPHGVARVRTLHEELQLESISLVEDAELRVPPEHRVDWVRALDPPMVALLADIGVEFACDGSELLVHVAAPRHAWLAPDARRLDALLVCVAELERRIATIAGSNGVPVPPAEQFMAKVQQHGRRANPARRRDAYLAGERRRDLELGPEELFAELARYADEAEVARVRAQVDAGTFHLEWLDDLVHHRRAAFWGTGDDADRDAA